MKRSMKGRAQIVRSLAADLSDVEIRDDLNDALRAVEPGFDWVIEVWPETMTVVYSCYPADEVLFYRRTYAVAENGAVTLNDDREQVEPKTDWKPVDESAADMQQAKGQAELPLVAPAAAKLIESPAPCGCQKGKNARENREGGEPMPKKDLIDRLLAVAATPFEASDRPTLEGWSETKLEGLLAKLEASPADAAKPTETTEAPALTEDEQIAQLPESLRAMIARDKANQSAIRANLTAAIGKATDVYAPAQLAAMSVEALEQLAAALKINEPKADYSGRVVAALAEDAAVAEPPKPYTLALAKRKAAAEAQAN